MRCEERFSEIYGRDPEGKAFCPYRICPIGAHSDHNLGKITGLAINKDIHIAYALDVPTTYADSEALQRDYGFTPKITLREGLRKFAEWYKEYYG